ncbi:MAG: hypothetical protein NE334_04600 [Lentisphaeraceae bacterium]|nr:hypothetical protein [Lentisphaeraceae bacterium]
MGVCLTIFVGAKDPLLMGKLNTCQTACCLVDPEDISEYKGYLPTFLCHERERVLQFSKNIFTQSSDPGFEFVIDSLRDGMDEYEKFKNEISIDLEKQIEEIEDQRLYQEIELQNALINFPSMLLGRKVSELANIAEGKTAFVLWDNDLNVSFINQLKELRDKVMLIAPANAYDRLKDHGVTPDLLVASGTATCPKNFKYDTTGLPLIADVTTSPALVQGFVDVLWSICPNFLDLEKEHVEFIDFESRWSSGRDSRLLALSVAAHFGCKEVILNCEDQQEFEYSVRSLLEALDNIPKLTFLEDDSKLSMTSTPYTFSFSLADITPDINSALDFISTVEKDICEEKESEILRSVLRACDFDALIKMSNGFFNYGLINYQEKDLSKKKEYFLSLTKSLKDVLSKKDLTEKDYREEVTKLFEGKEHFWDFDFELKVLAHANPRLSLTLDNIKKEETVNDGIRYNYNHKFKVSVDVQKDSKWETYEAPILDFDDEALDGIEERGLVIVPGLLDGQVQLQLMNMYPDLPIVTLINKPEYMVDLLNYLPLVSIMGRNGLWIHGSDEELAQAYKTLLCSEHVEPVIVDPDPENKFKHLESFKEVLET